MNMFQMLFSDISRSQVKNYTLWATIGSYLCSISDDTAPLRMVMIVMVMMMM